MQEDPTISNKRFGWLSLESCRQFLKPAQSGTTLILGIVVAIALTGLAVRILILVVSGNREVGPFSGVGDQVRYLTLADSIFRGKGFTYAGQPTALRPPLYPLLLAGSRTVFRSHYLVMMRIFQFVLGIAVAYVCLLIARSCFGKLAGVTAGAIALALPTLVFISAELQTEQLSTFLTVLLLLTLFGDMPDRKNCDVTMGVTSGLVTLVRFNSIILPIFGALAYVWPRRSLKSALVIFFVAGLIVSPWIVRNAEVFHGKVLFSSHGGINLLEGVLTPDGRAQNGEDERVRAAVGWLHTDIEINSSHRLLFASEDQLDKQARVAAIEAWKKLSWGARIRLLTRKCEMFWLGTDQLSENSYFTTKQRRLRAAGVVIYWVVLAFALIGWMRLFSSSRVLSLEIASYVVCVTLAHLPFVMNTRLRIPFIDPLISILAAGGLISIIGRFLKQGANGIQENEFLRN